MPQFLPMINKAALLTPTLQILFFFVSDCQGIWQLRAISWSLPVPGAQWQGLLGVEEGQKPATDSKGSVHGGCCSPRGMDGPAAKPGCSVLARERDRERKEGSRK